MPVVIKDKLVAHGSDELAIHGIRIEAVIGFSAHEEDLLQPLDVDVVIEREPVQANDDADPVLDYKLVKDELRKHLLGTRFNLIESVAEEVARRVLGHAGVRRVRVTVHKPGALTGASDVAVTIVRSLAA